MAREKADVESRAALERESQISRDAQYRVRMGLERPGAAAQEEIGASHTAEDAQIAALQKQASVYHPEMGGKELEQYTELQDKMKQVTAEAADKRSQIAEQEAERAAQAYMKYAAQANSAIIGGLNSWMTTNKSFANSMIDAGKRWTVSIIDDIAQVMLKKLEMMAIDKLVKTSTATAGAVKNTAQIAGNVAVAQSEAGMAAATAAAEAAFGGPAAAAAAGAAMLAAMQPFVLAASMDTGGIVPGATGAGVPILAHGGEAVLPQPMTAMLMNAANSGNGAAGHSFHSSTVLNATVLDHRGLEGFARRTGDYHAAEMKRQMRRANKVM